MLRWLATLALLTACGPQPVATVRFDHGFVQWRDSMSAPSNSWTLRGAMTVTYYEAWVSIEKDGQTYAIPRERIVYAASRELQ